MLLYTKKANNVFDVVCEKDERKGIWAGKGRSPSIVPAHPRGNDQNPYEKRVQLERFSPNA
jgi:hypothetical protein